MRGGGAPEQAGRPPPRVIELAGLCVAAAVAVRVLALGNVFPDEGWYLTAGVLVRRGLVPYRDFAFFQAPLSPYLYALAGGSLWAGRWISLVCGLAAFAILLRLLAPHGTRAQIVAIALVATSAYTFRWLTVSRNLAPAALLQMAALALYAPRRPGRLFLAGVAGALAAATRASAAAVLAALAIDLARRRRAGLAPLLAGASLGLIACVLPFAMLDPEGFLYCNLLYHTGLYDGSGGVGAIALAKLAGLARFFDKHALVAVLAPILYLGPARLRGGRCREEVPAQALAAAPAAVTEEVAGSDPRPGAALLTVGLETLLHIVPGGFRPEYHELVMMPLALGISPGVAAGWPRASGLVKVLAALLALAQMSGAQGQMVTHGGWSPATIARAGQAAAAACGPGESLVTFVPEIALAADRDLAEGLAMASCSLAAPELGESRARRLHLATLASLTALLAHRGAGAVVLAGPSDADSRRLDLYPREEIAGFERALAIGYVPVSRIDRWTVWARREGRRSQALALTSIDHAASTRSTR